MYTKQKSRAVKTSIIRNTSYKGETIEDKINRIVNNKEPITDGAALLYKDRREGVIAETNIRKDKWEHAIEAADKATKIRAAIS